MALTDEYDKPLFCTLGYPNDKVRYGFLEDTIFNIQKFVRELEAGELETFLRRL